MWGLLIWGNRTNVGELVTIRRYKILRGLERKMITGMGENTPIGKVMKDTDILSGKVGK